MRQAWHVVLLVALLTLNAFAAPELYVRNRPVKDAVVQGGEYYVSPETLERLFKTEERARLAEQDGQALVDGRPVGALLEGARGRLWPVLAVAAALGFEKRPVSSLGTLDVVPAAAMKKWTPPQGPKPGPEYAIARQRMQGVLATLDRMDEHPMLSRVEKIGRQIVAVTERPWVEWEFLVVSGAPNAATTGEGVLYVTDGLLALGLTDAELAGVLAHEISHGIARHPFALNDLAAEYKALESDRAAFQKAWSTRPRVRNPSASWIEAEQQRYRNQVREFERRATTIANRLANLDLYDQSEEEEADMDGMRYATLAGFERTGLMSALAKLEARKASRFGSSDYDHDVQAAQLPAGVVPGQVRGRSHPPTERRLLILRKVQASWK